MGNGGEHARGAQAMSVRKAVLLMKMILLSE